ncbi:MAG: DUF1674 domain-containing protein [Gammaproteobacteria bacterium]|nr:MAG: DUF1674 domain-containing protein [Gammaproteobacteria bacterium]
MTDANPTPTKIYQPQSADTEQPATVADEKPAEKVATVTEADDLEARRAKIDQKVADMPAEYGGRPADKGLEPTRYDDWEFKGRCIDF